MYYDVNIALNGRHYIATAPRSITSLADLKGKLPVLMEKFPSSEGYTFNVSRVEEVGYHINIEEIVGSVSGCSIELPSKY
jgi:hypothetical protein